VLQLLSLAVRRWRVVGQRLLVGRPGVNGGADKQERAAEENDRRGSRCGHHASLSHEVREEPTRRQVGQSVGQVVLSVDLAEGKSSVFRLGSSLLSWGSPHLPSRPPRPVIKGDVRSTTARSSSLV